ncbi:MAG: 2-oxoacid:acceptor oxidoreductase family protein [Anaerolineales bacterium]
MTQKSNQSRIEIRLAGEGGQGMILAGVILAEAAAIYDGKNVVQTQTYGPEARGGSSKAEVIISDEEIDYPEVINADILVAMSQEACDKYASNLKKDGLLIVDSEKVRRIPLTNAVKLPITRIAAEATGKSITANVVSLGILVGLTGIVSRESINKAIIARAPKGTEELNQKALERGFAEAQAILAVKEKA